MFTASLLVIAQNWNQFRYPSTGEWLNKLLYIHTMKYTPIKLNELLIYATTQSKLYGIMLSKIANLSAKTTQ